MADSFFMPTYKITISYDGTNYCGWQTQDSRQSSVISHQKKTIQSELEKALNKIFKKEIKIEGSGRTDAGVHALAQVAHFKTDKSFDVLKLKNALNANLPRDVYCLSVEVAEDGFHARFCARKKTYRYLIVNCADRPLFIKNFAAWVKDPLDIKKMRLASRCLVGKHDFKSFQASDRIDRRSETTVFSIKIKKSISNYELPFIYGLIWIIIEISASGFLRNMVRNVAGTLIEVGRGRIKPEEIKSILKNKDRKHGGPCAPAYGLYLIDVSY
ncbi:MAG TPA: tRNA pseudouridine(38-40) synthase TruA [Candidatus Omnitrophota bacterium]|nr:tRNA pseudouridine(38-40) synthase TruA [Candidatus Omnitrophota bacterium]